MYLTKEQFEKYTDQGFILLTECFSKTEVNRLKFELPSLFKKETSGRVLEEESNIVRAVHGSHKNNEVFQRLSRNPRLVEPPMQLLGSKVYIYQFKINAKAAFKGNIWEWHQDYIFWRKEDRLPTARVVNALVLLDDMNEFNGPLFVIPGSHKEGMIDVVAQNTSNRAKDERERPAWILNFTTKLKYSLNQELVTNLVLKYGILSIKASAGSVLFFDSNLVHASPSNISPFNRSVVIVTYNSVDNIPLPVQNPRPEFIVSRDYRPVEPLSKDALLIENLM
ncbi:phytanoyl-CoA dioxygenase family protein (plasmid) [Nostoc sp. UHCC 0926]|uniref:phytanoyl-CoA dioxygenase family protein n=1 Tax=Nostoc sp. UHCC 0926 TaxID=3025190 RepID=UPI00235EDA25|nr:phytanoyl-CoA dioxygenase family protein [Nostoc sp. UHCC 0926]WDD36589.1 phytanoyl-CoA dioxygenase family protein [Nostoc sp. UHCC 0926]